MMHAGSLLLVPLLLFVRRIGEFVKALNDNEAAARCEFAFVRAEIVDRSAGLPRPTPAPLDQIAVVGSGSWMSIKRQAVR